MCHHQKLLGKEDVLAPGHPGVTFVTEVLWLLPGRTKSNVTGFLEGEQSYG